MTRATLQVLLCGTADADARVRAASLRSLGTLVQGGGAVPIGACFAGTRACGPSTRHATPHAGPPRVLTESIRALAVLYSG